MHRAAAPTLAPRSVASPHAGPRTTTPFVLPSSKLTEKPQKRALGGLSPRVAIGAVGRQDHVVHESRRQVARHLHTRDTAGPEPGTSPWHAAREVLLLAGVATSRSQKVNRNDCEKSDAAVTRSHTRLCCNIITPSPPPSPWVPKWCSCANQR